MFFWDYLTGLPLIALAGLTLYIASKALTDALVGPRRKSPGLLALGQWLPIAAVAMLAMYEGRPLVALGLVFSSSIACLCLPTGAIALLGFFPEPGPSRRVWTLLLPSAILVFLAGFTGAVSIIANFALVLQGVVTLLLWTDRKPTVSEPTPMIEDSTRYAVEFRVVQFLLALPVAGVGAWMALHGLNVLSTQSDFASPGLLTATLLSPLLVLPIIGTGTEMSQRNKSSMAVDSQMGVVFLNLFALLPIVTGYWYAQQFKVQLLARRHMPSTSLPAMQFHPLVFPLAVWRVDVVMLIALGLFLLPVALGRWKLSRNQGLWMMVGYAVYLVLAIKFQRYLLYGAQE